METLSLGLSSRMNQVRKTLKNDPQLGKGFITSESYLRMDQLIAINKSNYDFKWKDTGNLELPQQGLTDTDIFIIVEMGLHLLKVDSAKYGKEIPYAYPNTEHFTLPGVTPDDLEAFYNGKLTVMQNNTEVSKDFSTAMFRHVPETTKETANLNIAHDSYKGVPGLKELGAAIVLNGQQKNEFRLAIPGFSGKAVQATSGTVQTYVSLYLSGFRIDSAASVHYDRIVKLLTEGAA